MKKTVKNNNKSTSHVEAFLFCPKITPPQKTDDAEHFFHHIDQHLGNKLDECAIFFNLPSALQYSRFMSDDHVVLRAFVAHTAVEGLGHTLGIKKGAVTKRHIHGCFPGWAKGQVYMENPVFDAEKIPGGEEVLVD
jgi:hypothetical protein